MAKGLRSKDKRANRSKLRNEITIPAMKIRQEIIAKRLSDDLKESSGKSITHLKKVLSNNKASESKTSKTSSSSNTVEDDIKTKGVGENKAKLHKYSKIILPTAATTIKKRGSKARNNPNKELVWFGSSK